MQKQRLLVTASTFPRWAGDSEPRFVYDLAQALCPYFDVTVLVPAAPGALEREEMQGLHVERYHYCPIHRWETLCYPGAIVPRIKEKPIRALLVPMLFIALWWNLFKRRGQYDAVHAHWLIPQGIVQSFFKTPYLVTGHGSDVTSLNMGPMKVLKRRCLHKAAAVTAVSSHIARRMKEICPDVKPTVRPMGCDCTAFSPALRTKAFFGQADRPVALFVGRLAEVKGVRYLIQAMESVNAVLVIAGDGPLRPALEEQAVRAGCEVRFLGAKTHEELALIYASADVFVAPSVPMKSGMQEGFGLVFLEAMASGLPVVATRTGGIPDLIRDGENGLLVPPADPPALARAINRVLDDELLRERLKAAGQKTAQEHSYQTVGAQYAQILQTVSRDR